ncbi:MAG: hypothetical protein LBV47_01565 [Bacteroidales bacterium]|jgi:hypothetical protein|nr:hypothetical protein [Bacteroidales bacterium]
MNARLLKKTVTVIMIAAVAFAGCNKNNEPEDKQGSRPNKVTAISLSSGIPLWPVFFVADRKSG